MAKTRKSKAHPRRRKQRGGAVGDGAVLLKITIPLDVNIKEVNPDGLATYPNKNTIINYVRETFVPMDMMEGFFDGEFDGNNDAYELISAEWEPVNRNEPEEFGIIIRVLTTREDDEIVQFFDTYNLEDGQYESLDDNGWIIHTDPDSDIVYAEVDFRNNVIIIEEEEENQELLPPEPLQLPKTGGTRRRKSKSNRKSKSKSKSHRVTRKKRRGGRR